MNKSKLANAVSVFGFDVKAKLSNPAASSQLDYLRVAVRGLRQKLERDSARPQLIMNEPAIG